MSKVEKEKLLAILKRFPERKILVIGDAIADRFLYGSISRVSREAPVFILKHEQTDTVPGGAANCALNLASLGAETVLISVAGDDEAGRALKEKLTGATVNVEGLLLSPDTSTITKVRILAGQSHSSRQQVIRIDYEDKGDTGTKLQNDLHRFMRQQLEKVDAVVISDYNYGTVSEVVVDLIREHAKIRKFPVLVDSRFKLTTFEGFTSATPNEDEVETLVGKSLNSVAELESAANELKRQLNYDALLVTRGGRGMMLLEGKSSPIHIQAIGGDQPVDVTGAGDTVIATFSLALASGATFTEAAHLANYAGGLVVMKRGTASINVAELAHSIQASFE